MHRNVLASLAIAAALSCGRSVPNVPVATPPEVQLRTIPDSEPTHVEMRNVDFHVGGDIVLHVRRLAGVMRGRDGVVNFDDSRSFTTYVSSAEAALSAGDLTNLMNNHVFAYPGAPLTRIKVELRDGELWQSGILHKGVPIPFKIRSVVSVTPEGLLRLHPVSTKIFCVNGTKLMAALHLSMEKMVDLSRAVGVTIEENDFLIDPIRVLPPPKIRGRVLSARVENGMLIQTIGPDPAAGAITARAMVPPDTTAPNYMYYRGGRLQFGRKLLMTDADMQVVDANPSTPFDFDLDRYMVQLIGGYSRTTERAGLWVHMPDLNGTRRLEQTAGGEVALPRDTTCECDEEKPRR